MRKTYTINLLSLFLILPILIAGCGGRDNTGKRFRLLNPEKTGIHFINDLNESHEMNIITYPDYYSGAGVSIGDIDNDGLPDVFFTRNHGGVRLYKNRGNFSFKDITDEAGLGNLDPGWYTGTCMVDINTDGYLDIYVSRSGMEEPEDRFNLLFINRGNGTFSERAREYGLANPGHSVNAVFFDYDKDGDLDAYISNQTTSKLNSNYANRLRGETHPFDGDRLYENIGDKFIDVSSTTGIYSSEIGYTHGAAVGDINDDGWDDLYVSNDFFEYDYLYINNGDKTFTESIKNTTRHISNFSMGNDMADFNNDGLLDVVVLDMVAEGNRRLYSNTGGNDELRFNMALQQGLHYQYMFNVLHLNQGNSVFSEIGMLAGISRTDWSWAPLFADFDNDGWKDLFITNGIRKDIRNIDWGESYRNLIQFHSDYTQFEGSQWDMLLESMPSEKVPNYMFKNNRDLTFSKVMEEWGLDQPSWSNGVAYGDLDNDGDLDLVINNVDQKAFVYENLSKESNFLRFKIRGPKKNPMGLGTKVRIFHNDRFQYQQHYNSRGYRSSVEPVMHFGLGSDTLVNRIEVTWPDGKTAMLSDIQANQVILLDYSEPYKQITKEKAGEENYFSDITDQVAPGIRHRETAGNDFIENPMLLFKLSAPGPVLAVGDVNNDGLDDFYLGGAMSVSGQFYIQNSDGSFEGQQKDLWERDKDFVDAGAEFIDADGDGDLDLYVVSGGFEGRPGRPAFQDRLYFNDGKGLFEKKDGRLPAINISGSVIIAADFDLDGDQDLFRGGRLDPGSYPMPVSSMLLINNQGHFEDVTRSKAPEMLDLGLVTDAIWSDIDLDHDPDLLIVGEWMPVTIFRNDSGTLTKVEISGNGLEATSGWWWSINAIDADKDGDEDYILGNMGLNFRLTASEYEPLELFAGDFDDNGNLDFLIAYHQDGKRYPVVDRTRSIKQNAFIKRKITSNDSYAVSTIEDIYGADVLDQAYNRRIQQLASGYLENRRDFSFEFKPFDNYAQMSAVQASTVIDVDRDGIEDILIAGNLYTIEAETIRLDAGVGAWLKNQGNGNFESIPCPESGLFLPGDVRDMKLIRAGDDVALLVAKNNDTLQVINISRK